MTRRVLLVVAALAAVQGLLFAVWYAVERGRRRTTPDRPPAARGEVRRISKLAPPLRFASPDGATRQLSDLRGRPLILHFWATWCPPCRRELPALLAFGRNHGMRIVAVSLDARWETVRRFRGRAGLASIVRARSSRAELKRTYRVHELPVTFVVNRAGRLTLRVDGAQNWTSPALRRAVRGAFGRNRTGESL